MTRRPDNPLPLDRSLMDAFRSIVQPRPEQTDSTTAAAERSLYEFVKAGWSALEPDTRFVDGWHLKCICEHLQALEELQILRLVINCPPGHAKSLLACVYWFAWSWVREAAGRWLYGSYSHDLVKRDSNRCRDLIKSPWYQERWGSIFHLRPDQEAATYFANDRTGFRYATTVFGRGLGVRVSRAVWDDPHKASEIYSEPIRRRVLATWADTISTRGQDPATFRQLVIMQRLADGDLSGHLLREVGGYECLTLPAEYEPQRYWLPDAAKIDDRRPRDAIVPTVLQQRRPALQDGPEGSGRTNHGDLLWPERHTAETIRRLRSELQAVGAAGQLQQRPSPEEGALFKRAMFRHYSIERDGMKAVAVLGVRGGPMEPEPLRLDLTGLRWFQTVDTALTLDKRAAYTAVATFAWSNRTGDLLVWDVWRERLEVPEQLDALLQLREGRGVWDGSARQWAVPGSADPWPAPLVLQAVEDVPGSKGVLQAARTRGRPMYPLKVHGRDKLERGAPVIALYRDGKVWHRAGAAWTLDLEEELLAVPQGAYWDQFDVVAWAGQLVGRETLLQGGEIDGPLTTWPPPPTHPDGSPLTLDEFRRLDKPGETVQVQTGSGQYPVTFDDDEERWFQR
jgi:phage terminase large subunit-like protein